MASLLSLKGNPVNVTGEENIVSPGFYMPNRLSVAVGKALHKLLDGALAAATVVGIFTALVFLILL